jgi:hypothetical protein
MSGRLSIHLWRDPQRPPIVIVLVVVVVLDHGTMLSKGVSMGKKGVNRGETRAALVPANSRTRTSSRTITMGFTPRRECPLDPTTLSSPSLIFGVDHRFMPVTNKLDARKTSYPGRWKLEY